MISSDITPSGRPLINPQKLSFRKKLARSSSIKNIISLYEVTYTKLSKNREKTVESRKNTKNKKKVEKSQTESNFKDLNKNVITKSNTKELNFLNLSPKNSFSPDFSPSPSSSSASSTDRLSFYNSSFENGSNSERSAEKIEIDQVNKDLQEPSLLWSISTNSSSSNFSSDLPHETQGSYEIESETENNKTKHFVFPQKSSKKNQSITDSIDLAKEKLWSDSSSINDDSSSINGSEKSLGKKSIKQILQRQKSRLFEKFSPVESLERFSPVESLEKFSPVESVEKISEIPIQERISQEVFEEIIIDELEGPLDKKLDIVENEDDKVCNRLNDTRLSKIKDKNENIFKTKSATETLKIVENVEKSSILEESLPPSENFEYWRKLSNGDYISEKDQLPNFRSLGNRDINPIQEKLEEIEEIIVNKLENNIDDKFEKTTCQNVNKILKSETSINIVKKSEFIANKSFENKTPMTKPAAITKPTGLTYSATMSGSYSFTKPGNKKPSNTNLSSKSRLPVATRTQSQKCVHMNKSMQTENNYNQKNNTQDTNDQCNPILDHRTKQKVVLEWCQFHTRNYKNVNITNFSTSWTDGLAFCALVHNFLPDSFNYEKLKSRGLENRRYNFQLAFDTFQDKLSIDPLLEVDDMISVGPDYQSVFTYLSTIFSRFQPIKKSPSQISSKKSSKISYRETEIER